jgi:ferredoxin
LRTSWRDSFKNSKFKYQNEQAGIFAVGFLDLNGGKISMAKVSVDASTCVGCGLCEQSCPEIFEVQGDGIAHVKAQVSSSCDLQEVALACPVNAIKVSQ